MTREEINEEPVDRKTVDAWAMRLCEIISKVLDIPRRNCDVGTPEEQVERHREWCRHDNDGSRCCIDCRLCFARWAQMPYEEGGAK